jgi:MraZ protein
MFIGEYHHNLDEKGRLALPIKFRSALAAGCVVTRGIDQCLAVYALEEWRVLAGKVANLPLAQATSRAFSRLMLSGAMDAVPDKQGRVVIPDYLRGYAKLGRELVVVGLYNRLEIWSKEAWEKYKRSTEESSTDIAEKLSELGV